MNVAAAGMSTTEPPPSETEPVPSPDPSPAPQPPPGEPQPGPSAWHDDEWTMPVDPLVVLPTDIGELPALFAGRRVIRTRRI